jgi:phosphoenolpyruvate carboxykinase (GTP)
MGSEATAAAEQGLPAMRRDPMAMLPFCGYHMGDYFAHWLSLGAKLANPPPIFRVNWFRREAGRLLWPGFGNNARVLVWMVERAHGRADAVVNPYGFVPRYDDLMLAGLQLTESDFANLMRVDADVAAAELKTHDALFEPMRPRLPDELLRQRDQLRQRLQDATQSGPRAATPFSRPAQPKTA